MEKINDSKSFSSLRDQRIGLDPDPSGTDSSAVSGCTSQLKFDSASNRGISSTEAVQGNPGKDNTQSVRGIRKKWTQEGNRMVMECYYRSKPKINGYRQQMHAIWRDKGLFNINEQKEQKEAMINKTETLKNTQKNRGQTTWSCIK